MSLETGVSRPNRRLSEGSEATVLRLHDGTAPAIKAPQFRALAQEITRTLDLLRSSSTNSSTAEPAIALSTMR